MKKIISLFTTVILLLSSTMTVFAQEVSTGIMTYAAPIDESEDTSISELEQFLNKDDNGLIVFDTEAALSDGFSNDIITAVEAQISSMNNLVLQGIAYIDENYSAIILLPSTRARGESKVVTHWYGLTEVYMNSDEAQDLIDGL